MTDNEVTSIEQKSLLINDKNEDDNEDGMLSSDNEIIKENFIKDKLSEEEEKEDGALSSDGELSSEQDRHEELDYGDDTIEVINKVKPTKSEKEEDGELSSSPDEGELTEDECSEDGEIRDDDNTHGVKSAYSLLPNSSQQEYSNLGSAHKSNGLCRFFMRGNCTWGNQCRYLHPISKNATVTETIAPITDIKDEGRGESSWERGIRQAKEAKQTASKRKTEDLDFEEKKLHQQLPEGSPNKKDSDSDSSDSVEDKNKSPKRSRRSIPNENNYRHPPPFFNDQMRPMRPFYPGTQWNNANFAPPFIPHGGMGPGPMMMGPGPDGFGPPPFPGPFMGPRHPFPQDARMLIEEKRRQQMLFEQHPHGRFNTPDGPRNERYGQSMDQYPNKGNREGREDRRNRNDRKPNQRADSWKDPWQRSQRSPKNRSHMDSRSRSRGRSSARGSRRSSYSSSYTSSSYSSRSSSYSSYSSRSSFDSRSRSSSRSRSRSSNDSRSRSVRDKRTVTTGRDNKSQNKNKNNDKNKSNTRSPYNSNRQSTYNKENHQIGAGNSQGPIPDAYNRGRNNNNRGRSHNGRTDNRGRDRRYGGHRNSHTTDRRSNTASSPQNNKEQSPLRKVEVKSSNSKTGSDSSRKQPSDTTDKRRSNEGRSLEPSDERRRHSSKSKNASDNTDRSDVKTERVNISRSMAFSESVASKEITDKKQNNSRKRDKKSTNYTDSDLSASETPKKRTRERVKVQFTNTSNVLKKRDILPIESEEEIPLEEEISKPVIKEENVPIIENEPIKEIPTIIEKEDIEVKEQEQLVTAVATNKPITVVKGKETRREELLKQLKAVEDAIARKRAKVP